MNSDNGYNIPGNGGYTGEENTPPTNQNGNPDSREGEPCASEDSACDRNKNPYSHSENPYSQNGNPYSQSGTPYSQNGNPYSQNRSPYSQSGNPYAQNGNPYSQNGYGNYPPPFTAPPKKPSLLKRLTAHFTQKKYIDLSIAATAAGLALILQRVFDFLFGTAIGLITPLRELYFGNYIFQDLVGMVYSLFCVGLPFFGAYIFLKKASDIEIPFGAPLKKSGLPFMLMAGMGIFYVGNLLTNYLVTFLASLGIELYSYETAISMGSDLPKNAFEFIVMAIGTAVIPALVEEFAFRGVVMQSLRRYGDWFAVIVSAVLFGLIHGNMMQMPFAIVAGIVLGYVCVVTNSIWVSVILHFMNNFLSLVYSFTAEILSEGRAMVFSALYTYGIILIGAVALAGFAFYNPRFMRLYPSKVAGTEPKKCAATYFLMPAMILPLIMIFAAIFQDIKL